MNAADAAREPVQVPAEAGLSVLSRAAFTIARLEGDLDIATAPALRERLLGVLGPGVRLLIIDLSGVSFCDAAGLAVLIGAQRRTIARGIVVRLAAPRPQLAKLLRITGLDRSFTICASLADALPTEWGEPRAATSPPPAEVRPETPGIDPALHHAAAGGLHLPACCPARTSDLTAKHCPARTRPRE
jgi:anti-anti-sigma factor